MDSFSLLRYWRGALAAARSTTLVAAPLDAAATDDDGPFFDLELAVGAAASSSDDDTTDDEETNATATTTTTTSLDVTLAEDIILSVDASSVHLLSAASIADDEEASKPQLAAALLKSATRIRVFLLGFRNKQKPPASDAATASAASPKQRSHENLLVRFRIDDVPFASLFSRDAACKPTDNDDPGGEKRLIGNGREVVQKYLSKIKPMYVRVSRRYVDRLRFSGLLSTGDSPVSQPPPPPPENPPLGAKPVRKIFGKSKSATSPPPPPPPPATARRRDDTLLQQEDGIQSAIAHCKRSFTSVSKGSESPTPLARSLSDPIRLTNG